MDLMRVAFALLIACGNGTLPLPKEPAAHPPPYVKLFDVGTRWELPAHLAVRTAADQPVQEVDGSMWCVVTNGNAFGDARTAWVECGGGGEIHINALPRMELVATPAGLWTTGNDATALLATRADVDAVLAVHAMRMGASPATRHFELAKAEREADVLDETIDTFRRRDSWCMRHRVVKPGEVDDATLCFDEADGVTGGDATNWREHGFVAQMTFGDAPPEHEPEAIPPGPQP